MSLQTFFYVFCLDMLLYLSFLKIEIYYRVFNIKVYNFIKILNKKFIYFFCLLRNIVYMSVLGLHVIFKDSR